MPRHPDSALHSFPGDLIGTNEQRVKEEVICKKLTVFGWPITSRTTDALASLRTKKMSLTFSGPSQEHFGPSSQERQLTKEEQEDYRRYRQQIVQIDPVFKQWTPQQPSGYDADFCTLLPDRGVCLDPSIRQAASPTSMNKSILGCIKDVVDNAFLGEQPKRQEVIRVFIRRLYQDCHLAVQEGNWPFGTTTMLRPSSGMVRGACD